MDEQEKMNLQNDAEPQPSAEPAPEQAESKEEKIENFFSQQNQEAQQENQQSYQQAPQQNYQQTYYSQSTGGYDASKEPGYSPYSAQSGYNYTANQTYANNNSNNDASKKNGKSKGKVLLCLILAAVFVFCGISGALIALRANKKETTSKSDGDAQLVISDSAVAEVDESDGLSSEEIYSKNIKSNVGVILYGSTSSLFSMNGDSSSSSVAGEGSGIVMGTSKDKTKTYIITCAHVIEYAKTKGYKAVVQDYNGEQYDAEVVGYDSKTDIGVLAVNETGFTAATFGDSSKLKIGETVYAIGNPGGTEFFGSYTKGMVSAIERPVSNEIGYDMKCIQHDAAINPGNSGGMLINAAGQVVGINSSKIASTEYEGMGFAIPISSAKTIVDDIIANGYVTDRPKLGISYAQVSQYQTYAMIAHYNNLPAGSLIIAEIAQESAFSGTDAKEGDLIIAVDGKEMETADVLLDKIENGKVGDKLKLTLCRIDEKTYDVKKFDVTVTLIEDKGTDTKEESTTQSYEDYFNQFFGGNFGY